MLAKDPGQRLSMAEALEHPWIRQDASAAPATLLSSVVVSRLQSFTRTSRLERLLLNVAAHQLTRCRPASPPPSGNTAPLDAGFPA
jgi:calcium-dependent protein kinase